MNRKRSGPCTPIFLLTIYHNDKKNDFTLPIFILIKCSAAVIGSITAVGERQGQRNTHWQIKKNRPSTRDMTYRHNMAIDTEN